MKRLALVALAVGSLGCTNDEPPVADPGGDPAAVIASLARAQCAKMFDCCSSEELESSIGAGADKAACEAALLSQAEAFLVPSLARAQEEKTVLVVEGAVPSCERALESLSCADFEPSSILELIASPDCAPIVSPKLTLSGFCTDDFECDTGLCSHPPADTEGTCKARPQIGDPCLHDRCDNFLACSADGICVEKLGLGDVCARNADCLSGRCEPNVDGEVVCEAAPRSCDG